MFAVEVLGNDVDWFWVSWVGRTGDRNRGSLFNCQMTLHQLQTISSKSGSRAYFHVPYTKIIRFFTNNVFIIPFSLMS